MKESVQEKIQTAVHVGSVGHHDGLNVREEDDGEVRDVLGQAAPSIQLSLYSFGGWTPAKLPDVRPTDRDSDVCCGITSNRRTTGSSRNVQLEINNIYNMWSVYTMSEVMATNRVDVEIFTCFQVFKT